MIKIDAEKFYKKIYEVYEYDEAGAKETGEWILDCVPEEILPNIVEWYEGKKLSDIRIEGFSIAMILTIWNSIDFLRAAVCMMDLKRNPEGAKRLIWYMRR